MNKTPISIALERQIPEFIREDYGLFVKFIKAYYAFLEQTQQRNLEDIRSVENTLDEFIVKFKKELSVVFPTNSLENEKFILQRIREFYMTRGSVESFQFLFRSLFNKDATIYYPSQQILRASDGKWSQETSVFTRQTNGNLALLSGKIIKIVTSKKHIDVFCTKVIHYREDVYEVFIDRKYVADIDIGNEVTLNDNLGIIIPCPAKYSIVEEGKGFTVGAIYNLPSESGNGSTVKITKVGPNGEIKKVQIITFGLDYESNFYAKLSNKTPQAIPYYQPIRANDANKALNPYQEKGLGYIDYGYINTQNYFYYDTNYPIVDATKQYFYADGSYVGEVIGSFYTNASGIIVDEDTAEIKIELGPVAKYPGFYQKNDGFISDETYIHDGKYYQLFSYVIKVEEQLDKYKDIVLSLLHPAGLELFAEYTIRNDFILSATPLLAYIRRQFFESEYTADYSTSDIGKLLQDIFSITHTHVIDVTKPITGDFAKTDLDYRYNDVSKIASDTTSTSFTRNNDVTLVKSDIQNTIESTAYSLITTKSDNTSIIDFTWSDVNAPKQDFLAAPTDIISKAPELFKGDTITSSDDDISKFEISGDTFNQYVPVLESFGTTSVYIRSFADTVLIGDYSVLGQLYSDTMSILDQSNIGLTRTFDDTTSPINDGALSLSISGSTFRDTTTTADSIGLLELSGTAFNNIATATNSIGIVLFEKYISEDASTSIDNSKITYSPTFFDGINNSNTGLLYVNQYNQDIDNNVLSYFSEDFVNIDSRALT